MASSHGKLSREFTERCEAEALRLRSRLGIAGDGRMPARAVAEHLGIPIVCPKQLQGLSKAHVARLTVSRCGFSAVTIPRGTRRVIVHNTGEPIDRQESNLFHELGHCLCGHEPQAMEALFVRPAYSTDEDEANWMGGCLHLPRPVLEASARARLGKDDICRTFCASRAMVTWRLNMTRVKLADQAPVSVRRPA